MTPLVSTPGHPSFVVNGLSGPTWLDPHGIAVVVLGDEPEHTLSHAQSQLQAFEQICEGVPRPVLADFTNSRSMSREAREFYTGKKNMEKITALAIVSRSRVGQFVANFFVGVNLQTEIPICICEDVNTAHSWLKRFSKSN